MVNQSDNPKLAQSIDKLSGLLRYVVYETKNDKVPIHQEIAFIQHFVDLNLLRFEEGEVDFKIDILGTYNEQEIEPGIFLCYVENAFKHGVQPEEQAFITIRFDLTSETNIDLQIENSLPTQPIKAEHGGSGIESNNERLRLAYPDKHTIGFQQNNTYIVNLSIDTDEGNHS